jgi:hypothetical protein
VTQSQYGVDAFAWTQSEKKMARGKHSQFRLTDTQVRALTLSKRPALDARGKTVLVDNVDHKPYRVALGGPGIPGGFGVFVGATGAFYEVRDRLGEKGERKEVRIPLGSAQEKKLDTAVDEALQHRQFIRETGQDPRVALKSVRAAQEARGMTVGLALERYIERLKGDSEVKKSGVAGAVNSLARLSRPEVALATVAVGGLSEKVLRTAWGALRQSAMERSNRLPDTVKKQLKSTSRWWELDRAELSARLSLKGKMIELAYAAGMAAAEHTFGDASRAVEGALELERMAADNAGRPPAFVHNPFSILRRAGLFRSTRQLRKHYEAARVRNPLGVDDAKTGQKSLPSVLKALIARRNMQKGWNSTGVDYLLLTLLWGTRRNEGAQLRWFDSCSDDEVATDFALTSWVWLTPSADAKNPSTGLRGSQVFLHDTKSGDSLLLPVAYFAERVMLWRLDARKQSDQELAREIEKAVKNAAKVRASTRDVIKRAKADAVAERWQWRLEQSRRWVFPARNTKAVEGHYSDSKSLLQGIRKDTGLADFDIGLTPHDFRRTMGRFAAKLLPGNIVSKLLNHHIEGNTKAMAKVSERYTESEWPDLQEAMAKVDEAIIATSPRVWNILKKSDKPRLDERDDADVVLPTFRSRKPKPDVDRS